MNEGPEKISEQAVLVQTIGGTPSDLPVAGPHPHNVEGFEIKAEAFPETLKMKQEAEHRKVLVVPCANYDVDNDNEMATINFGDTDDEDEDEDSRKRICFAETDQVVPIPPCSSSPITRVHHRASPAKVQPSNAYIASVLERQTASGSLPHVGVARTGVACDVQSGKIVRRQVSVQRITEFQEAMNPMDRRIKKGKHQYVKYTSNFTGGGEDRVGDDGHYGIQQFRLRSSVVGYKFPDATDYDFVNMYLMWTFRTSFLMLLLSDFVVFFVACNFFSVVFFVSATNNPECLMLLGHDVTEYVGNRTINDAIYWTDSYQLSWTTFATVGYGAVYPRVAARGECDLINTWASLESFLGILFASFCGAVLFNKIVRVQSVAHVQFSDQAVIQYGTGVPGSGEEASSDAGDDSINNPLCQKGNTGEVSPGQDEGDCASEMESNKRMLFPCPVLEFRIANKLHYDNGGEIMLASVSAVVSTEALKQYLEALDLADERRKEHLASDFLRMSTIISQTPSGVLQNPKVPMIRTRLAQLRSPHVARSGSGSIAQKLSKAISSPLQQRPSSAASTSTDATLEKEPFNDKKRQRDNMWAEFAKHKQSVYRVVYEGNSTDGLSPPRMFSPLEFETDKHPYFKRLWHVRHVLNEASPLLSAQAIRMITANNGQWPQEFCNYQYIRENLQFHQIIISLNGTLNSSGSSVYAMHVYTPEDISIGWSFVESLDLDPKTATLFLNMSLTNVLREQDGGGGEPLSNADVVFAED